MKWITDKPEPVEDILVAEAGNHPNVLVLPFSLELIRSAASSSHNEDLQRCRYFRAAGPLYRPVSGRKAFIGTELPGSR